MAESPHVPDLPDSSRSRARVQPAGTAPETGEAVDLMKGARHPHPDQIDASRSMAPSVRQKS